MDLEQTFQLFLQLMNEDRRLACSVKKTAGIPFLYIACKGNASADELALLIEKSARTAMRGKRLTAETVFVREDKNLYVFRHRFYVPQEKMFCCGNLCDDCIRLKNRHKKRG
ncbi:hypothetical protein ACTSEZ_04320 [Metabacillus sp. JX24]|uniref:hypothetical protein n=1 Tax=Metabacillus sp. JX24 TaxID=3240759 RepID=UPI00350F46D9